MSGAVWVCFCGGRKFKCIGSRKLPRPSIVYAKCITCDKQLAFNKYGMREMSDREKQAIEEKGKL